MEGKSPGSRCTLCPQLAALIEEGLWRGRPRPRSTGKNVHELPFPTSLSLLIVILSAASRLARESACGVEGPLRLSPLIYRLREFSYQFPTSLSVLILSS